MSGPSGVSGVPLRAPVARGTAIKIVATVVVVAGSVGYLLSSSMKAGAEYYKHVDEVTSNADAWRSKKLQVHGNVVAGSIEQAKGTLLYRFKIESRAPRPPAVITATYNGLVPDTFKDGAEVVAKGTLTADNQLSVVPDGIMAKCPSKYEADKNGPPIKSTQMPAGMAAQMPPGVAEKL